MTTGVCGTVSNGTQLSAYQGLTDSPLPISLYDIMCAPTGSFATAIVSAYAVSSSSYWVNLTAMGLAVSGNDTIRLLPNDTAYASPPVVISRGSNNRNMYEIVLCSPGLECSPSKVTNCAGGYYCPDPFAPKIQCPSGYFCPKGSVTPFSCSFLDSCPAGSSVRTQLVGVFIAGLVITGALIIFAIVKLAELWSFRKWKRRVLTPSGTGSHRGDSDVEEGVAKDFEQDEGSENSVSDKAHRRLNLPPVPRVDIAFSNLDVVVGGGLSPSKQILSKAQGRFPSDSVTAIMGGSGAGKTTLVDALLGNVRCKGSFIINGEQRKRGLASLPAGTVGYVPQLDVLLDSLTVREVLEHAAAVRLPGSWTRKQRKAHVNAVIATLGLTKCERLVIGDGGSKKAISGGQRKRVAIGIELIANPSVLILDECTTGLDATSALVCADLKIFDECPLPFNEKIISVGVDGVSSAGGERRQDGHRRSASTALRSFREDPGQGDVDGARQGGL